jgi:hypothetical protein
MSFLLSLYILKMVLAQGIEPQTDDYKSTVIPFNYASNPLNPSLRRGGVLVYTPWGMLVGVTQVWSHVQTVHYS